MKSLLDFCRDENWSGWDPYDGLSSPLFNRIPLLQNRICRLAFIQSFKRSPINLRPLLRVPKEQNPKGLALFAASLVKLATNGEASEEEAHQLLRRLIECRSPGQPYACWGYNFDWQTRTFLVPKFTPNIICSTFAGNALLDAYEAFGTDEYLNQAATIADFLLNGLNRTVAGETFCFSYTPLDSGQVHNASLLGAAFLARLYRYTRDDTLREPAIAAMRYSVDKMRPDGSWVYGEGDRQQWVDSFHTGYNLRALEQIRLHLELASLDPVVRKGYDYFLNHFFTSSGTVKYFHNQELPIDLHGVATAIITLVELAHHDSRSLDQAWKVWTWASTEMRSDKGWFYYQKRRFRKVRIPYMRWVQAWILLAMVVLHDVAKGHHPASANTAPESSKVAW